MTNSALDALILKVVAVTAAASPQVFGMFHQNGTVPFFNVSISTLGMSAAGSMIAFAYGTPIKNRKKLYGYAIGGTFIGVWGLQLMLWQGVDVPAEFRPPVGAAVALLSRWIVPFIAENMKFLINRIFGRPNDYQSEYRDEEDT